MLSLPKDQNYTRGLAKICKEEMGGISSALKKLEWTIYISHLPEGQQRKGGISFLLLTIISQLFLNEKP